MSNPLWSFRGTTMLTDEPDADGIALDLFQAFEPAEVAGKDLNVPRRPGMIVMPRYPKRRILLPDGHVKGLGATEAARWTAWRTATDSLFAVMDRALTPGAVIVFAPYLGLAADKTLTARCSRIVPGEIKGSGPVQYWRFELECVDDPPEWAAYVAP